MAGEDGVETLEDFAQSLMDDGTMDLLMEDSAPGEPAPEPEADTGSAVERPRDDKGRFISTEVEDEQPEAEAPEEPAEPAEEQPEASAEEDDEIVIEIDDDLATVLERYDGDVTKALRALSEKETMVGRQANEVGELRAQLAEMRQLMEQGFAQQPQDFGPYQNDLEDNPKGLVYEALERGDQETMAHAIRAWGEEEPFEAAAFLFSLNQRAQVSQPEPEPVAAPQAVGQSLETAMADVVARHPDVERYLPSLGETAKEFPTLRNFMEQGTPAQKAQAFEELLVITKTRASQSDTSAAVKRVILKTQEEVRKEKADAAVLSAQTQSAAAAQPTNVDRFYELFDEAAERFSPADWIVRSND